jgi:hypothetical protein
LLKRFRARRSARFALQVCQPPHNSMRCSSSRDGEGRVRREGRARDKLQTAERKKVESGSGQQVSGNARTLRARPRGAARPIPTEADRSSFLFPVVAADSLAKRDVFRLPDPFAVVTVDGEQTNTTTAIKVRAR